MFTCEPEQLLRRLAFGLFLLLAALSLFMAGPQVQADEGSYLLNAAMIAGRADAHPAYGYYSGYSLLLLPAFLLQSQPASIYHIVLVINALLVASTPFALYRLTRGLWPDVAPRTHVIAALVASCYAPVLMLSQLAMSESALVPLYAWLLASGLGLLRYGRLATAATLGALAGFLFLVHPRGATMVAPTLLIFSLFALASRQHRRAMALAWLAAIAVAAVHGPLEQLAGRTQHSGGYSLRLMLDQLAAPGAWRWLLFNLAGTTTEAVVTSCGVFVVAMRAIAAGLRSAWASGDYWRTPHAAVLLAGAAGMAVALIVTAAFFVPPERADQLAYGRYALPTLVPLLAIGLVRLHADRARRSRDLLWAIAAGLAGIAVSAWAFTELPTAAQTNWNFVNAIVLHLAQRLVPFGAPWTAIGACFIASTGALWLCLRHSPERGITALAGFNAIVFAVAWLTVTQPGSQDCAHERYVVDAAHAFASASGTRLCVSLDRGIDAWHRPDLGWRLFPQMARPADGAPCANARIQPLQWRSVPGMRLVSVERPAPLGGGAPIGLFVETGPALDAFANAYALPPLDALEAFPVADRHADVAIEYPAAPLWRTTVGAALDLRLRVTNRSGRVLGDGDADLLPYPVLAGARVEVDGKMRNFRANLPQPLAPGQSTYMTLRVGPLDRPGRYPIHVGILQEFVDWFGGGVDAVIEVTSGGR